MGDVIDIKCNNCNYLAQLFYGGGMIANHEYYYCPKCFKIREYSTDLHPRIELPKFRNGKAVEKIHKCKFCKIPLSSFKFKNFEHSPDIKGPARFRCPECNSKDLTYEKVGLWD